MNSNQLYPSLWRYLILLLLQMLLFKQVGIVIGPYFNIFLWPLFILLLPINTNTPLAVFLGFLCGLSMDFVYNTIGIGASAGAFAGFARPFILRSFEPKGGFSGNENIPAPAHFGWAWFMQVSAIYFFLVLFWYFSVDAFTFVYITTTLLKTFSAWGLTMVFVLIFVFLSNPRN